MNQYHRCIICLGSNHQGIEHIKNAEKEIEEIANKIHWGDIIETKPENTSSSTPYHNRAALLQTSVSKETLIKEFKRIEQQHGRTVSGQHKGIIPLDIDLLMYDNEIVKPADFKKEYVQQALQTIPFYPHSLMSNQS